MDADSRELFELYLKDHLAAGVGGTELAKRAAKRQRGTEFSRPLQELSEEIEHDLHRLREVAVMLGVDTTAPIKSGVAWIGEKLGRLKLNKRLFERSPSSLVLELELLQGAVISKRGLWQTLAEIRADLPSSDSLPIDEMLERIDAQHDRIRQLHTQAVRVAFSRDVAKTG